MDESGALLGREEMLARMEDHITTIMTRYRGKVGGWDVVNEALGDDGTLLNTRWVQTVGEDFVAGRSSSRAGPIPGRSSIKRLLPRQAGQEGRGRPAGEGPAIAGTAYRRRRHPGSLGDGLPDSPRFRRIREHNEVAPA